MIRRHRIYLAADDGATTIAIPASASPTGQDIIQAPEQVREAPEIHQHQPSSTRAPGVVTKPVDVAAELGLRKPPSELLKDMAARARGEDGKFIKETAKPKPKAAKKPEAKPAEETQPPAPTSTTTQPPATTEPKIKIGDQEKTAAEWADYHRELAAKAEAAAKAPETKPPDATPAAKTPEQEADEEKAAREAWYATATKGYAPTQEEFDAMLASGDVNAFGGYLAKVEDTIWQRIVREVGPHIDDLKTRFESDVRPLTEQRREVQQYQTERGFMDANPTISAHPQGLQVMRDTAAELHAEHDDLKFFLSHNPTSPNVPRYQARAKELEDDFLNQLAKATIERLGVTATPPPAAATPAPIAKPLAPQPPRAQPPAPTGQVGMSASGRAKGGDPEAASMRARGLL